MRRALHSAATPSAPGATYVAPAYLRLRSSVIVSPW